MFYIPRLIQIRNDHASCPFLGMKKPVFSYINANVVRLAPSDEKNTRSPALKCLHLKHVSHRLKRAMETLVSEWNSRVKL
jgi:hypothetical protein